MVTGMEPKSKTRIKKEMLALQALGEKLVELSADQIKKIDMPLELRDALLFAKTINKGEARRRQLQYIGVLMRRGRSGTHSEGFGYHRQGTASGCRTI